MSDLITISSSLLPSTTRVVGFRGTEAISRLYRFDVYVTAPSEDLDFDLDGAIGTKARLAIADAPGRPPCFFAGIVGDIALLQEFGGRALLEVAIVPRLADLALSRHSRLFTNQSAIDVIKAVLEEHGVTNYESHVAPSGVEEHICQYRESDLDFISRWMEREGIRYYFEHGEDGEKLILADDATYPEGPVGTPVRYYPQTGDHWSAAPSTFRSFSSRHTTVPASIKLRDNDYTRPSLRIYGEARVSPHGSGEVNRHGERFFSSSDGQRLAQIRAEEKLSQRSIYQAAGTRRHLHAGYAFELEDHPRPAFNARYLVTEAHHHVNQAGATFEQFKKVVPLEHDEVYLVELTAVPATTRFRPASVTEWPRIYGLEGAVVDGSATSDYAQIDSHGRYSVKLHFDESTLKSGKASTLVRMMQPHGGDIEGFHFPLRKGTEVVISFLGGDPDRPVISGVVPNAINPSPVTSGNHTKNVIQTGGRNRLEIEDLAGQERITLSTPLANTYLRMGSPNKGHHAILKTEGHILIHAGENLDVYAGGHKHETIVGEVTEKYESTKDETVTGALTEKYESTKDETVTGALTETYQSTKTENVTGIVTETYGSDQLTTVTGDVVEVYESAKIESVTSDVTEIYGATKTESVTGTVTETYGGLLDQTLQAGWTVNVTGNVSHTATGDYSITYGGSHKHTITGSTDAFWKGPVFDFYYGNKGTLVGGGYDTIVAGVKDDFLLGLKFEMVIGASMKFRIGPEMTSWSEVKAGLGGLKWWYHTLHIKEALIAMGQAQAQLMEAGVMLNTTGMYGVF